MNEEAELVALDDDERREHLETTEIEFFCACGRADCDETILLTAAEYAAVHEVPHRFIVAPGHETPEIERIVERHPAYDVVEKRPSYQTPE